MSSPLVLYHNDTDGFCSAWVASRKLPAVTQYRAVQYGDPIPPAAETAEREVFVLDFAWPAEELVQLKASCKNLVVIDHHATSREAVLAVGGIWDKEHAGCYLAWEYFNPSHPEDAEPPVLVEYVQDRDLWRFDLPESQAVNAVAGSLKASFADWQALARELDNGFADEVALRGNAILDFQDRLIERMSKDAQEVYFLPPHLPKNRAIFSPHRAAFSSLPIWDDGEAVLAANATVLQSELGQVLATGRAFSITWAYRSRQFTVNLRSADDGMDVSEIAKAFGGGGHRH